MILRPSREWRSKNYGQGGAMGRAVYPYELTDPDFSWLIHNFQESCPDYVCVQDIGLPVAFVKAEKKPEALPPALGDSKATTEVGFPTDTDDA